jgi:ABC-2 type transport system permease protein
MPHALGMYFRLLSVQLRSQMQFRASFWVDLLTTAMLNFSYFAAVYLILERFENIAGWSLAELAFLYGMIETSFATMDMFFSGFDPDSFTNYIRNGQLDQLFLRPVNIVAQVFGSKFLLRRFGRIAQGLAVLIFAFSQLDIHWTALKLAYLPLVWLSQFFAMGALFIFGATLTIWTVQPIEAVNVLTYGGVEVMSYPTSIYTGWMRGLYTYVIPFIFLNYYPALFFLDKADPLGMPVFAPFLAPLVAAGMLWLALRFFQFGLDRYQGTGS